MLSVTLEKTVKGWAVSVANGSSHYVVVFRKEENARDFAESERTKLGLKEAQT